MSEIGLPIVTVAFPVVGLLAWNQAEEHKGHKEKNLFLSKGQLHTLSWTQHRQFQIDSFI